MSAGELSVTGGGTTSTQVTISSDQPIFVFGSTMRNVTIRENVITRTGQAGINISGTRLIVLNNRLTDVGGGGIPGFIVDDLPTAAWKETHSLTLEGNQLMDE